MRTIGLIGGMSWQSTKEYYRIINEETERKCGKLHSAPLVLYSVDFAPIKQFQDNGEWDKVAEVLAAAAQAVERAGADMLLLCTNTMHKLAVEVQSAVNIPLIHSIEATAIALKAAGISTAGLLGTRFTMQDGFFRDYLKIHHNITTVVPPEEEQGVVNDIIYNELCVGEISHKSRAIFQHIIRGLKQYEEAQAVILGCTEIGLLVGQDDVDVRLFDTTEIHSLVAVDEALSGGAEKKCSQAS